MKCREAAAQSPIAIAVRIDEHQGSKRRVVIYSLPKDTAFLQVDMKGDFWEQITTAECDRYNDWEPGTETWYERIIRFFLERRPL
jgi:hypothetical protein